VTTTSPQHRAAWRADRRSAVLLERRRLVARNRRIKATFVRNQSLSFVVGARLAGRRRDGTAAS